MTILIQQRTSIRFYIILLLLYRLIGRREIRRWHYQAVKALLAVAAFTAIQAVAGQGAMLILAVIVASTLEFDYWDTYAELLGVALVLSGSPWLVAIGAIVWGLSRETALVAPLLTPTQGWLAWALSFLAPITLLLVRRMQGRAELYCPRWTFRLYNLAVDRELGYSILLTLATTVAVIFCRRSMPSALAATAWAPIVWIVAGWTLARARETRIFLPACIWLAAALGGIA